MPVERALAIATALDHEEHEWVRRERPGVAGGSEPELIERILALLVDSNLY